MEKRLNAILILLLSVLLFYGAGCANSGGLAIAGKTSTLGLGGELTTAVTSNVNARVGLNTLDFDFDDEFDDIDYDIGLDFSSFSALADWYLFDNSFRISGGVISMNHELDLDATGAAGESEDIGDGTYDWADIGTLSGSIEVDDLAPYVGIGWGDPVSSGKRWGFYCDFGVAFTESPDVKLSATGTAPGLAADLQRELDDIEDDVDSFKFYPVLSTGLFFRF